MKERNLVSAVEFVEAKRRKAIESPFSDEQKELDTMELYSIYIFCHFLAETLNISQFIPAKLVDGKWLVLKGKPLSPATDEEWDRWENERDDFKNAQENVVFEGFYKGLNDISPDNHWEFIDNEKFPFRIYIQDVGDVNWVKTDNKLLTVEDLIGHNITLTPTAHKKYMT